MSIKKPCQYCGEEISLRKMPEGHWLAFDYGSGTVHKCVKKKKATSKATPKHPKDNGDTVNPKIGEFFQLLLVAINNRNDVNINYFANNKKDWTNRTVTPIRIYTKDNSTYLEGYCHLRKAHRDFKVSRIAFANIVPSNVETAVSKESNPPIHNNITSDATRSENKYATYLFLVAIVILVIYFMNK